MATRSRTRKPLTKERVLEKAIALADKEGIDALSMRKLGQSLGVEAMSLYNHVANKGELIAAMVDSVVERFELPEDEPRWDEAIRRCAISAHDLLIEHEWACTLALLPRDVSTLSGPRIRYMEWLLRRLREAGFPPEVVYSAYHTLDSHIFGFTLWQLGHAKAARMMTIPEGQTMEEWAAQMLTEMRPRYPDLAEHAEQHMAAGARDGRHEFEFGLDLILDGLKKLRRKRA
ncbi:MAG TPA: TetR/AcrR family transcriptional regulator C-terminal domain-containing protein [Gaiellaceae bacterium]